MVVTPPGSPLTVTHVELRDGTTLTADHYVLAVPFDRVADLLPAELVGHEPYFAGVALEGPEVSVQFDGETSRATGTLPLALGAAEGGVLILPAGGKTLAPDEADAVRRQLTLALHDQSPLRDLGMPLFVSDPIEFRTEGMAPGKPPMPAEAVVEGVKSPFDSNVKVAFTKSWMVVESDGIPTHKTGDFPNDSNPNQILKQDYRFIIPREPKARFDALRLQALGDGLLDALILIVYEGRYRPAEKHEAKWLDLQGGKVDRALAAFESAPPGIDASRSMLSISVAGDALTSRIETLRLFVTYR